MLEIVAITYNGIEPVLPIAGRVPAEGGTIGRGDDNAVVLPDPMRVLSRRHLQVSRGADGAYRLANISASNPVLLNERVLHPGETRAFDNGDRIAVGCYVLGVRQWLSDVRSSGMDADVDDGCSEARAYNRADGEAASIAQLDETVIEWDESPAAGLTRDESPLRDLRGATASQSVTTMPDADAWPDVDAILEIGTRRSIEDHPLGSGSEQGITLADLVGDGGDLLRDHAHGAETASLASALISDPLGRNAGSLLATSSLDPLTIFGGEADDALALFGEGGVGASAAGRSEAINHRVELNTPFVLPTAQGNSDPAPSLYPLPAHENRPGDSTVASNEAQPSEQAIREAGLDASGCARRPDSRSPLIPEDFALEDLFEPMLPGSAPAAACPQSVERPCAESSAVTPPQPARPAAGAASPDERGADSVDPAALYEALLAGLQLDRLPDRRALDPAFMHTLGALLRIGVEGTVQMMVARATVKREVRANVTLIEPRRNNPLKFSPDGGVALMYLLGSGYPGFMEPEVALTEAFEDLYIHQLAMVSGMRSALDHVLRHFDPETISHGAGASGVVENLLSLGRKAKLWDAYGRHFEHAREQAEDRFHDFFGAAFVDAYEESARGGLQSERKEP